MYSSPYSTGNTYFSNGYQPNTINGSKLKKTGLTVGDTGLKGSTSYNGKNMDSQNIWKDGSGNQWIWIRTGADTGYYIQYHAGYKGAVDFNGGNSSTYDKYMVSSKTGTKVTNKLDWGTDEPVPEPTRQSVPIYNITYSPPKVDTSAKDERIAELEKKLEGYLKVWSAPELAELYGIDYNEANILKDYNEATNKYYDDIVAEQNKLRTQYVRNNAQYLNQITDSYLDSYKNAAPTAVGKGTLAANALSTQLAAGQTNASNDYGMLQNVNNLEKTRQAELVSNVNEAKQYYNQLGTMLSTLGANKNVSDVAQYVATLDKYSSDYAADRAYATYLAQANAAKFSGLANASQTSAASTANTNAWNQLYDFYEKYTGSKAAADSTIAHLLSKSAGS